MFDAHITHILIDDLLLTNGGPPSDLLNFASTSRSFQEPCFHHLFSGVRWPHKSKADQESGFYFFPEGLWPYIRYVPFVILLSLQCHYFLGIFGWTDSTNGQNPSSQVGNHDKDGTYVPALVKLSLAIEKMSKLSKVTLSCPFVVP